MAAIACVGWSGTASVRGVGPTKAGDGRVAGYIQPCEGIPIRGSQKYAGGSVHAVRGSLRSMPLGNGAGRIIFPTDVVSHQYVPPGHRFTFALPPTSYGFPRYADSCHRRRPQPVQGVQTVLLSGTSDWVSARPLRDSNAVGLLLGRGRSLAGTLQSGTAG
jgi:hypothetical protein